MPEFVGFQIMGILVPYGIIFDAVGIFGLAFHILFKSCSTYCAVESNQAVQWESGTKYQEQKVEFCKKCNYPHPNYLLNELMATSKGSLFCKSKFRIWLCLTIF